jgi:hypothetical protein
MVSHEIRRPMNAIIGLSRLALTTPLSQNNETTWAGAGRGFDCAS